MSQTIQYPVRWIKYSFAVVLFAVLFVLGIHATSILAQNTDADSGFGFEEDNVWGSDLFGDDSGSNSTQTEGSDVDNDADNNFGNGLDSDLPITVPKMPAIYVTPAQVKDATEEQEQRRQEAAALRSRPTPSDDGIQITFQRGQQRPVTIDPTLKRAGETIIVHPQVDSEYINPGGFRFRGIYGAWPQDEYLVDGGDDRLKAYVRGNWEIRNLNPEDTIAHYDTLDNRRLIEQSNRVPIYSPRFGSVRKIDGAVAAIEWQHYAGTQSRSQLAAAQTRMRAGRTEQKEIAGQARANVLPRSANAGANTGAVEQRTSPMTYGNQEVTASLSQLLTHTTFSSAELAYLAEAKNAAEAWAGIDHLEVQINEQTAQAMIGQKTPEAVFIIGEPETSPKLRLFKVASKETAQRGEIVEFMIRFDNVGSEVVGNVTIADSLTARLEYIDSSAGSSVPAEFFIEPNEAGSHILRWEITEPLHAGDFGVVRFRCRVQ